MSKPIQSVKASFVAVWLWTLTPTNDPLFLALAMLLLKRRGKKKKKSYWLTARKGVRPETHNLYLDAVPNRTRTIAGFVRLIVHPSWGP